MRGSISPRVWCTLLPVFSFTWRNHKSDCMFHLILRTSCDCAFVGRGDLEYTRFLRVDVCASSSYRIACITASQKGKTNTCRSQPDLIRFLRSFEGRKKAARLSLCIIKLSKATFFVFVHVYKKDGAGWKPGAGESWRVQPRKLKKIPDKT